MTEMVSCIIPAYNEERYLSNILKVTKDHPLIKEVIVVDDASTDKTSMIVENFGSITLISHKQNLGKSDALSSGLKLAKSKTVLMLDADLLNLSYEDLTNLIEPVVKGETEVTMSLRKNIFFMWKIIGIDFLTGERCLPKKILEETIDHNTKGYTLETKINKYILEHNLKFSVIPISAKYSKNIGKHGFIRGILHFIKMVINIRENITFARLFIQLFQMYQNKSTTKHSK